MNLGALRPSFETRRGDVRPAERLRRLAEQWPSFDDEERALLLEQRLHHLREEASV